jgi:hypothetical protein
MLEQHSLAVGEHRLLPDDKPRDDENVALFVIHGELRLVQALEELVLVVHPMWMQRVSPC